MQIDNFGAFIGLVTISVGVILILAALLLFQNQGDSTKPEKRESRGIILLGPIPIVWGFGDKGKSISCALILVVLILWIMFLFF